VCGGKLYSAQVYVLGGPLELLYQQYHQNTHNPGTDMMVVCLSGSFIISDTFVWWMLPDDAGSDICLMAACRNKGTHKILQL